MHGIRARSMDTSEEAERIQVDLLRAVPVSRRLSVAYSLSAAVMSIARRALERANPQAEQGERDIWFVELHYGSALALAFRQDLMRRLPQEASIRRDRV